MSAGGRPIVVGVDDSPSTELAIAWAIEDARARKAPIRFVCAFRYELPHDRLPAYLTVSSVEVLEPRQVAHRLVATAVDAATAAGVEADGDAVDGDPARVLLEESDHASVLVLGSRQLQAFGSAVIGSVSAAVAARSHAPTVVVRGSAGRPEEGANVVVGVDGTEASETVLAYGFEYASRHRVTLRAVLCWHPDVLALMSWRLEQPAPARVEAWLSEALAGWREKYPDVPVRPEVIREHPTAGLVMASASQYLLVVGNRGRQALAGTLLGSVSQGVLHRASCPVVLIPTHRA